ncbi:MAG: peptidoglycan editing factor PgeF [Gammaproteobacteria bacterium]
MSRIELIEPDWEAPANVVARVSTRVGGYSEGAKAGLNLALHVGDDAEQVQRNRRLFLQQLDGADQLQWLNQVHGADVARIIHVEDGLSADAVVTETPGIACCVMTADCLPLFLCNKAGTEIAVVHCGWRGMAAGVVAQTIAAMHSPTHELMAWMGPAIGVCHFEVGEDVLHAFWGLSDEFLSCFVPAPRPGKYWADLYEICRLQLSSKGVGQVSGGGFCTFWDEQRFFSHRRDADSGRIAAAIFLRES